MPTYKYECKSCSKIFEVDQRITADPLKDCDCGAQNALRRLIQPTAILFKGAGFHINDYNSTSSSNNVSSENCSNKSDSCNSCKS